MAGLDLEILGEVPERGNGKNWGTLKNVDTNLSPMQGKREWRSTAGSLKFWQGWGETPVSHSHG